MMKAATNDNDSIKKLTFSHSSCMKNLAFQFCLSNADLYIFKTEKEWKEQR